MLRRPLCGLLVVAMVAACPTPADAWGFGAHRFIMDRAISLLPPQIRPFFEQERATVVERAVDPDLWRIAGWDAESPRHFVDMDAYGPYPFKDVPRDFEEAVKKHGREFVERNGTLPWRTQEIYLKLVDAFGLKTQYSRDNIRFFSSVLAHYVGDGHVPFHAALNHDGQLTEQWGIHARFESELFERYRTRLRIKPGALTPVPDVRNFMFDTLTESFSFVQQILDADKQAVGNRDVYGDGYYGLFFGKVRPVLEDRLSEAITAVASLINAAWTEAGRPALPRQAPKTVEKVRRK